MSEIPPVIEPIPGYIPCSDPDHETRNSELDWSENLGWTSDTAVDLGMVCGACARLGLAAILEFNRRTKEDNEAILKSRADLALSTNSTFLANVSPTNADVLAQVRALTKENNALIRLLLEKMDSTEGT